jgi:hypothetical protein
MNRLSSWDTWLHGLFGGAIGGAASAGSAWLGMAAAKAGGADVPTLNLKALGIILGTSALTSAFLYLKQSPLPEISTVTQTTVTQATTVETATTKSDSTTPKQ